MKNTPLYEKHLEAGARMVPFSGWNMPVQYSGIIEEHLYTRTRAGLFDICHMGEFLMKGPSARRDLDRLVSCRVDDMPDGRCRYGFLLNEAGGIIDDLIVFRISDDEFMLVVNAGTAPKDRKWIEGHISPETSFRDISDITAKLDLQGPLSGKIMNSAAENEAIDKLKRYNFTELDIDGVKTLVSRTGYTGELGYELFFPAEHAERFWDRLMGHESVRPVGLGARDTLRLEMGYSLYGSDIDENHTPFEANLARFVCMEKDFIGKEALARQQAEGLKRTLAGFICETRRSARSHFRVTRAGGEVGEVTSGAFSPCLKKGIGLCYIDSHLAVAGTGIVLTDGRVEIEARVKSVPLYEH